MCVTSGTNRFLVGDQHLEQVGVPDRIQGGDDDVRELAVWRNH